MYYVESVIDGILCCKISPNGPWKPLSQKTLTSRVLELEKQNQELKKELEESQEDSVY